MGESPRSREAPPLSEAAENQDASETGAPPSAVSGRAPLGLPSQQTAGCSANGAGAREQRQRQRLPQQHGPEALLATTVCQAALLANTSELVRLGRRHLNSQPAGREGSGSSLAPAASHRQAP